MELDKNNILISHLEEISSNGTLDGGDADRKENLHRLFMYPAMMVPATQNAILKAITEVLPDKSDAVDPFMGSGTSLMSCMEFGYNVYGQDINPFAVLLTKAKTCFYDIKLLEQSLTIICRRIEEDTAESVDIEYYNIDKWFNKDIQLNLSKIRRAIISEQSIDIRRFFWVVLSETVRIGSNDRTSTFKLHQRSQEDIAKRHVDIIREFINLAKRGIADLKLYIEKLSSEGHVNKDRYVGTAEIRWGDTQKAIPTDITFDLLVSSPPYGDNLTTVTYGQTSFLPLLWIAPEDIDCPYDYTKTTSEIDRQSLGGVIKNKQIQVLASKLAQRSSSFKSFYEDIPSEEKRKYNKTVGFISDFDESLDVIIPRMKQNAYYVWTIGNRFVGGRQIPNSEVLVDLMQYRGIKLLFSAERNILNKKQACKNRSSRTMEKEQILIFHNS